MIEPSGIGQSTGGLILALASDKTHVLNMRCRLFYSVLCLLLGFLVSSCRAPETESNEPNLKSMEIRFTETPPVIDGKIDDDAWKSVSDVGEFEFPWWESGVREGTRALLRWDAEYLYALFVCEDAHVWSENRERDGPVYEDDCVEIFTSPDPDRLMEYYNVEMNVRGQTLDH